ncbi:MAG: DUF1772 domain-containing protein [Desulfomonilia bacterium]|jgi:hypothetical protein
MWKDIVLWLFIINLGIAFGAGIYEARVVIPPWANIPPREWPNTGLMFWVYVTTVPLTVLTIASLIAAWLTQGPMRFWYLAAVCIVIVERIATFSYFIPTMVRLMGTEGLPDADVQAALSQWLFLNNGRHVLTLTGWLAALKALSLTRPGG